MATVLPLCQAFKKPLRTQHISALPLTGSYRSYPALRSALSNQLVPFLGLHGPLQLWPENHWKQSHKAFMKVFMTSFFWVSKLNLWSLRFSDSPSSSAQTTRKITLSKYDWRARRLGLNAMCKKLKKSKERYRKRYRKVQKNQQRCWNIERVTIFHWILTPVPLKGTLEKPEWAQLRVFGSQDSSFSSSIRRWSLFTSSPPGKFYTMAIRAKRFVKNMWMDFLVHFIHEFSNTTTHEMIHWMIRWPKLSTSGGFRLWRRRAAPELKKHRKKARKKEDNHDDMKWYDK